MKFRNTNIKNVFLWLFKIALEQIEISVCQGLEAQNDNIEKNVSYNKEGGIIKVVYFDS
jgi:hypothetical protein